MQNLPKLKAFASGNSQTVAGKVLLGAAVLSGFMSIISYTKSFQAQQQIQYRKRQLRLPVVKLTQEQVINPPWNYDNLDQWLYRRVEVTGKQIHRLTCMIPRNQFEQAGYQYVVPLVAKENKDFTNRYGILLAKGFIPQQFKHTSERPRIESTEYLTFLGFVSRLDELKNQSFLEGNAHQKGRLHYTCSDIEDLAKSSEFLNQKQASVALIEKLYETGVLDERSPQRYENDCHFTAEYPWAKTESGALQLDKMPWHYRNDAKFYLFGSIASLIVGASVF